MVLNMGPVDYYAEKRSFQRSKSNACDANGEPLLPADKKVDHIINCVLQLANGWYVYRVIK
jgi:hypothetical protein